MLQMGFAELARSQKQLRVDSFLQEMERIIPWDRLLQRIEPHYYNSKTGRPPYELLFMLKIHCLQQWYALSDKEILSKVVFRSLSIPSDFSTMRPVLLLLRRL